MHTVKPSLPSWLFGPIMCVSHWGSPPCTWVQPHGYNLPLLAWFYWHLACFAFTADTLIDFLLVVLLFEHHRTLPLPSHRSSHPTLCLRGWRCRLCLATHSIVTLLPLIPWGFIPAPPVLRYHFPTFLSSILNMFISSYNHVYWIFGHFPDILPSFPNHAVLYRNSLS